MALIFSSGWEDTIGTAATCTADASDPLTDNFRWNGDYGPGSGQVCSATPPMVRLDTAVVHSGSKALRIHFKTGDGANGPDFRMNRIFPTTYTNLYFRWYQYWDANWRWASADHKLIIVGPPVGQNVYFNVRGNGGGGASGRLVAAIQSDDAFFSDAGGAGNLTLGAWNLIEAHITSGPHGTVRMKLNGVDLTLTKEVGAGSSDPLDVNTGDPFGYFKIDTTYNDFAFFEANVSGGSSNTYYDDVAVDDAAWIGAVDGTGGGGVDPDPGSGCTYSLGATTASIVAAGASSGGTVTTAGSSCAWTTVSNVSWITITAGASRTDTNTFSYTVAANTGAGRVGTITVAGLTLTVTQAAAASCSYSLNATTHATVAAGDSVTGSVTTGAGCAWTTVSNVPWITITAGASRTGTQTFDYTVAVNAGALRIGTVTIAGLTLTVTQAAAAGCTFALDATTLAVGAAASTQSGAVTTTGGCTWTAVSHAAWITVTAGATGTGSGTFNYSVSANAGTLRSGSLTVAGVTLTVTQAAAASPAVDPQPDDAPAPNRDVSLHNFLYDLPADKVIGTWAMVGGTILAAYPLTNIDDGVPSNPVRFVALANPSRLVCDHASAQRLDLVSFIHCNFPAGYLPVVARGDVIGSAATGTVVTCPGPTADLVPSNPFVDLTGLTGYGNYRYTWIDLPVTTTQLSLGQVRLTRVKREAVEHLGFNLKIRESHPLLEHMTDADTQIAYSRGTRARWVQGTVRTLPGGFAQLQRWWRQSRGRLSPFLLILDDTQNEALWVRWGNSAPQVFEQTVLFEGIFDLPLEWEEVGRGLRP